ncbi:hypothetical protein GFL85_33020 [Rhizobium laguerreae]|uniref:hypothetical protein n=1 Tax=Rhizobium laguerreae TaxID=1076926 RepID=UPI00143F29FB|nr:hypothetical protein [Rhizobium laguerreae]NKM15713.1 hypothetical protein [Rhizobium laguerreae]
MAAIQNAWGASGRLAMPDHQALLLVGNLKLYFRKASPRTSLRPVKAWQMRWSDWKMATSTWCLEMRMMPLSGFSADTAMNSHDMPMPQGAHGGKGHEFDHSEFAQVTSLRINATDNADVTDAFDGLDFIQSASNRTLKVPDIKTAAVLLQQTDAVLVLPVTTAKSLMKRYVLDSLPLSEKNSLSTMLA